MEQDDEIYNLYMDGTVYGELWKLEKLFDKILKEVWVVILDNYRRKKFIKLKAFETLISKAFFFLPNANYCTVFQFKL